MAKKTQTGDTGKVWYSLALARILLGLIFLWAFFDKLFGLGIATPAVKAWVNGGSPTTGFLKSVQGPFADVFNALAGQAWADWLFMLGLLGLGIGLLFGIAVRLSATLGSVLLFLMWMASLPIKTNPIIDDHLVYIAVLTAVCYGLPQQKWSLKAWWQNLGFVKSNPWLT